MRILWISIFFIFITACATGEKTHAIEPGMSQEQVVSVMGKPDGFRQSDEYTIYQYTNRLISGWSWDRADYSFIFKNNLLVEYGPGEVREKNVGGVHTIFLYQH